MPKNPSYNSPGRANQTPLSGRSSSQPSQPSRPSRPSRPSAGQSSAQPSRPSAGQSSAQPSGPPWGPTPGRPRAVAALGVFDGVHRGHQALLDRVLAGAGRDGAASAVVTFDPPPAKVFAREPLGAIEITPAPEKTEILRACGIEHVRILPFTLEFARLSAETFVREVLLAEFDLVGAVVGHDFSFGAGRQGDPSTLTAFGRELGFWVEVVPAVTLEGARISSSRIRDLLREGDVRSAAALMGRELAFRGRVVRGEGRGVREFVPTANLSISPDQLLPAPGVYRVWAEPPGGGRLPGVASVGPVPTLGTGHDRLVEVHILNVDIDLRDQALRVGFVEWLRPVKTFPNAGALREAILADVEEARKRFANEGYKPLATDTSL